MDTTVVVSVIAAASSVIVTAVSFYLTKKKEREADWRKYKYEQYKELLISMSEVTGINPTLEGRRGFAKACNSLHLIGSTGVLVALHRLQDEIKGLNTDKSVAKHDAFLSKLIWEIRKDIDIPGTPEVDEFSVHLVAAPPINESGR